MATKPNEVTEMEFLSVKDVMKLLGLGHNGASETINQLNEELKAKGYLVIPHKIIKSYLLKRYGVGVKI